MASLKFAALLLALFCIFLMQQTVESGFVKRDTPSEPSGFEKLQEDFNKLLESAKEKASELASKVNADEIQKALGNVNVELQKIATKVSDEISKATSDLQKKD